MTFVEEHLEQHVDEVEEHRGPEELLQDENEDITTLVLSTDPLFFF